MRTEDERIEYRATLLDGGVALLSVPVYAALTAAVLWVLRIPIVLDSILGGIVASACWLAFVNNARVGRIARAMAAREKR